jgi:hypothetical protein
MATHNLSLNGILDSEFLTTLAKSADLYKIGSNTILDPEEIRIGLKVVPRAVMSMLISELVPMEINCHRDIKLPFGKSAYIAVNKNAADDFTGSVYDNNKLVYDFRNRSIPGLGIILLSTFELYDMEELSKPNKQTEDTDKKIQNLIDQRMELHSLVARVVEDKLAQREVLHKLMMNKLTEAMKAKDQIAEVRKIQEQSTPKSDPYFRGMTNGMEVANSIASGKEPNFVDALKTLDIKPEDIAKKESSKKTSPLKAFLDRKKKPQEFRVEMAKSETVDCPDCGKTVFGHGAFSACICYGQDRNRKIWIKKSEDGISLKFSRGWSEDNIEMLLETLRRRHGKS